MVRIHTLAAALAIGTVAVVVGSFASAQTAPVPAPVAVLAPTASRPATQHGRYAKFDGINGDSVDPTHPGWIEVNTFQWGAARDPSSAASSVGARSSAVSSVSFTKWTDKTSAALKVGDGGQGVQDGDLRVLLPSQG